MRLKALKYENDYGFENYNIIKKCSLNLFDVSINSNKFFTIELHQNNSNFRIFTEYGRVGVSSTKQVRIASNLAQAEMEFNNIKKSKEKKNYVPIELAQSNTGSDKAQELIDITKIKKSSKKIKKNTSKLCIEVQEFVKQIFDEAEKKLNTLIKGSSNNDGSSPLGKLSVAQLNKGRNILQEIANKINANKNITINDVLQLSNEYYNHIPKSWGRKVTPSMIAIKTLDEVSEQMDILNFYENALVMDDIMFNNSDIDKKYESLKSDINILR
jgi:predicted DNA-binding WGR domain protein